VPESLGTKLRSARESKGLTIEQLSSITKININFLIALENGRWDLLPGRMYLKPFTKACAEALDLDVNELYDVIDGISPEERAKAEAQVVAEPAAPPAKKRFDYKVPIVLVSLLIIILLIAVAVRSRRTDLTGKTRREFVVPARGLHRRAEIKWERPWQRPPLNPLALEEQRLRLEASDDIKACVVADGDTVFQGILRADSGKSFYAGESFVLTISRSDKVTGYLNGLKIAEFGSDRRKLNNFLIQVAGKDSVSSDEAE